MKHLKSLQTNESSNHPPDDIPITDKTLKTHTPETSDDKREKMNSTTNVNSITAADVINNNNDLQIEESTVSIHWISFRTLFTIYYNISGVS